MAEDTRQANVVLTADTSQYSQQMTAAAATTNSAVASVEKLISSMDRLQRSVSRKLDIISAVSITGITAATMAAAKFESQLSTLHATAAITGKNFNIVKDSVDSLRRGLPASTEQIIALVSALQKMGVSTPKVKELADTFIKLGAATGEDVGQLATGLVGLQRAMGTTEEAIKSFADQTAHLSATMGVSATGILQFAQQLAPVARVVGMTQTEVAGFSTAFVKAGQDGYAAANVFSKMLTDISRATRYGSSDIYAYANAVGMTAEAFKQMPAAQQMTTLLNEISRQGPDAVRLMDRLGYQGPRDQKSIQALVQSGGLNKALNEAGIGRDSNATETGSKAAMDGLNDSLKVLQNNLTSIAQTFGKTFLPAFKMAVDVITSLTRGIRSLMDPLGHMLSKFALIGAGISGIASVATTGIGVLAAAGGAYALLRNPLTAGFMQRRAIRSNRDMSAFTRNTSQNMATRGTPFQRMLFGWGQRAANVVVPNDPTATPRQNVWRRMAAATRSAAADTAANARRDAERVAAARTPSFFRSGAPLLPGQIRMGADGQPMTDSQGNVRRRFPWAGMRFGRPGEDDRRLFSNRAYGAAGAQDQMLPARPAGETFRAGLHGRNLFGRAAMGVSGLYQGSLGMIRSQIDPIRWGGTMDATARPGYQWKQTGDTLRRAWTGEGAGVGKAMQGAQLATTRFAKAALDATLGVARLGASAAKAAAVPAARRLVTNLGGVARGAMGMMGGPLGLAMMAGFGGMAIAGQANQARDAFRERIGSDTAADSAVNKYATSLGLAAVAATSFADTVNAAAKAIDVPTVERAKEVTAEDAAAASSHGYKMNDKSIEGMTEQQAAMYATSVYARNDTDPKVMQQMKLDLLHEFGTTPAGQKTVEGIIAQASGQWTPSSTESTQDFSGKLNINPSTGQTYRTGSASTAAPDILANGGIRLDALMEGYKDAFSGKESNNSITNIWKPGKKLENSLSQIESTYSTLAGYTEKQFGPEETGRLTNAVLNQVISKFGNNTQAQGTAIAGTLEEISGVKNLKIGIGDVKAMQSAKSQAAKQEIFYNAVRNSGTNGEVGAQAQALLDMRAAQSNATSLNYYAPKAGSSEDQYSKMGVYDTQAGALFKGDSDLAKKLQSALIQPENKNLVLDASTDLARKLTELTGSAEGADAALQNLKNVAGDPSSVLYQLANQGQTQAARSGSYTNALTDQVTQARRGVSEVAFATQFKGDDAEERKQAKFDAQRQTNIGISQQFMSMYKAFDDFDRQRARARDNFNLQQGRQQEAFNLQRKYQEEDYQKQRTRGEEAYNLQRAQQEEDHARQLKESAEDYNRSRQQAEDDYAHQIEQQIKSAAATMQSAFERVQTKASWDAKNLLTNMMDQQRKMEQQQKDLATVRGMGLSGEAISTLGLNDFANQQQLQRMVGDFANNPELVQKFNEAIKGKLDMSKAFVTDPDSEAFKESQRAFQLQMDRQEEERNRSLERGDAAYQLMLDRQAAARDKQIAETDADYQQMADRQVKAQQLAVSYMVADFEKQMKDGADDMAHSMEILTLTFDQTSKGVLSRLTGVTQDEYGTLAQSLKDSEALINGTLSSTNDSVIKLMGPLFGGEDNARKALAASADAETQAHANPSAAWAQYAAQNPDWFKKPTGGGYGSEASYDSMSGGGGIGGADGAHFPLPAGSWNKSSNFGMRMNPVLHIMRLHAGTDLAARPGTPIGAAQDGIVTKASVMGGLGNMVEVSHADGTKTWYGHMSMITSKVGQVVSAGQQIGLVGSTGNSTGPHLHFERHINGTAVDPWGYLQGLQNGTISGAGDYSGTDDPAAAAAGMRKPTHIPVMDIAGVKGTEDVLSHMTPGGSYYSRGLFSTALQTRVNKLTGVGGSEGAYAGGGAQGPRGARSGYVRGGVVMDTRGITNITHIDAGTDFNGGIVVVAQDPEEMGRKLAEKKRMKALTRPTRSN